MPVLVVVLVFAVPLGFYYYTEQVIDRSSAEVASRDEALNHLSEMESALRQEQIAAHQLLFKHHEGVVDHQGEIADFQAAAAKVDFEHNAAAMFADSEQERAWFDKCKDTHQQVNDLFMREVVPAASTPGASFLSLEQRLQQDYEQLFSLRALLADSYMADRNQAMFSRLRSREAAYKLSWVGSLAAIGLGLIIAAFSARRLLIPIKAMAAAAINMSRGDLKQRVDTSGSNDELAQLGKSFNFMAESLERRTTLLEQEKARIRSIHQSIGDGILVVDRDGVIISANPAAEVALGKTVLELERSTDTGVPALQEALARRIKPEDMVKCWEVKQCTHPECPSYESDDLRCWLQCGTHCHNQIQGTFKQKRDACERCDVFRHNAVQELEVKVGERYLSVEVIPILDDEGQEGGRTVVLRDITSLKRAKEEEERHSAEQAMLKQISEAVSKTLDPDKAMEIALNQVLKVRQADIACIHLLDQATGDMIMAASKGRGDKLSGKGTLLPKGQGCPQHVVELGRALVVSDLRQEEAVPQEALDAGLLSYVGAPLKAGNKIIGVLSLASRHEGAFTQEDGRLLTLIGLQAGVALENAMLYRKSVENTRKALAKNRIVTVLTSSLDLEKTYDAFAEETNKLVPFDRLSIALIMGGGSKLQVIASRGSGPAAIKQGEVLDLAGTTVEWVAKNKRPYVNGDIESNIEFSEQPRLVKSGIKSQVNLPLVVKGKFLGTMNLSSVKKNAFSKEDIDELKPVADQVAIVLANQKLFEDVLRAKKEWETTFDATVEGIVIVGKDHTIMRLNKAAARIIGGEVDELVGRKCYQGCQSICWELANCPMMFLRKAEGPFRYEQETAAGRTVEVILDPMFDEEGNLTGAVHLLRDITEAKRMRQQLLQSEKMVAVGQLVAGVAHEINNPLTGVMGYSQLLLSQDIGEKAKRDAEAIYREAERATRIVQHLLSFARKHNPKQKVVDINSVVRGTLELKAYDLKVNNILVESSFDENIPLTMADPHLLQQVFLNLITNAEQAMLEDRGSGLLKVSTKGLEGKVQITFADDGPGVPEELRERIFEPFFTTKDVGKGTGLGLSVCYGVVEEHGGSIWVEPTAGRGATFVVELPVVSAPTKVDYHQRRRKERISGNVLLVDDEATIREMVTEALRRAGHLVDTARNGEVALRMLKKKRYDCVISDIKMPGMDGAMLHQAVREMDPEMASRFVFISGDTISPETQSYLSKVDNPHLTKPFRLEDLEAVLQSTLASRRRAKAS